MQYVLDYVGLKWEFIEFENSNNLIEESDAK